jgi:hypothetical protein
VSLAQVLRDVPVSEARQYGYLGRQERYRCSA